MLAGYITISVFLLFIITSIHCHYRIHHRLHHSHPRRHYHVHCHCHFYHPHGICRGYVLKFLHRLRNFFCFIVGLDSLCAPFLSLNFNDEGENYNLRSKECTATSFYGKPMNLILPYSTCLRLFSGIYPQVSAQLLSKG